MGMQKTTCGSGTGAASVWNCAELGLGLILVEFETVQLKTASLLTPSTSARASCSKLAIAWRGSWFRKENAAACLVLAAGKADGPAKISSTCWNQAPILNGLGETGSFQPFGTRMRHKPPGMLKAAQDPSQPSGGVSVSSTLSTSSKENGKPLLFYMLNNCTITEKILRLFPQVRVETVTQLSSTPQASVF